METFSERIGLQKSAKFSTGTGIPRGVSPEKAGMYMSYVPITIAKRNSRLFLPNYLEPPLIALIFTNMVEPLTFHLFTNEHGSPFICDNPIPLWGPFRSIKALSTNIS